MKKNKIKKVGFLTSGGDSPGMNAAIRSVVRSCSYYNVDCFGIQQGFQGLINNDMSQMNARSVNNIIPFSTLFGENFPPEDSSFNIVSGKILLNSSPIRLSL